MTISVNSPKRSPSLDQDGKAFLVDEAGNRIPVAVVVEPDSAGHTGLAAGFVTAGRTSQVTAQEDAGLIHQPSSHGDAPVIALCSVDGSKNLVPFSPKLAQVATLAGKVTGKFQSGVRTATGSEESIAHGLGVIPSLVLISLYDPNSVVGDVVLAEGTHTTSNLKVTVTANAKYKVIAFA